MSNTNNSNNMNDQAKCTSDLAKCTSDLAKYFDYSVEYHRIAAQYKCAVSDPELLIAKIQNKINSAQCTALDSELVDNIANEVYMLSMKDHSYERYATCSLLDRLYKLVPEDMTYSIDRMQQMSHKRHPHIIAPMLDDRFSGNYRALQPYLQPHLVHERDRDFSYFGLVTVIKKYLLRLKVPTEEVVERPQHMYMRLAVNIHQNMIVHYPHNSLFQKVVKSIVKTYDMLSRHLYTHATPTIINSGTLNNQLASCFLMHINEDSIHGIYDSLKECALISKGAGGIGMNVNPIRGNNSFIHGTNGTSHGLPSMLKVFDGTSEYVDQGGNNRKGAFAMYIEPWHIDVFDFVKLRRQTGSHEVRVRSLLLALWVPDLFMRRVEQDLDWTLFSPDDVPDLLHLWGDKFNHQYELYENDERYNSRRRRIKARALWSEIIDSQIETGLPYMLYKDACNSKSNHQHLGAITCSNLCTEIVQYSSPNEIAVCNLASVSLAKFVVWTTPGHPNYLPPNAITSIDKTETKTEPHIDYKHLGKVVRRMVTNMDYIIDVTRYPLDKAEKSNKKHRPIGLGIQGLADVFLKFGCEWGDETSHFLNRSIFECIYFNALTQSCKLAKKFGKYVSYENSPVAKGLLQMDMWPAQQLCGFFDWPLLRANIAQLGVRNSLLTTVMPTASTSQIMGNSIAAEPYADQVFRRKTQCGDFLIINRHLEQDLKSLGLWTDKVMDAIIRDRGSVQDVAEIPDRLKRVYRTIYEIPQRVLLDMAAERGRFIDQSQSQNIYFFDDEQLANKIHSCHFHGWKLGLKTGQYYMHIKNKHLHANPTEFHAGSKGVENVILKQLQAQDATLVMTKPKDMATTRLESLPKIVEPTGFVDIPLDDEKTICRRDPGCESCQ